MRAIAPVWYNAARQPSVRESALTVVKGRNSRRKIIADDPWSVLTRRKPMQYWRYHRPCLIHPSTPSPSFSHLVNVKSKRTTKSKWEGFVNPRRNLGKRKCQMNSVSCQQKYDDLRAGRIVWFLHRASRQWALTDF